MENLGQKTIVAVLMILSIVSVAQMDREDISTIYLTFQQENTSNNITVNYHISGQSNMAQVYYDTVSRKGVVADYAFQATGSSQKIKWVRNKRFHRVELTELQPATTYYFVVGNKMAGFSSEYHFRTLPADDTPILMLQGGDMGPQDNLALISESARESHPDVILIGGDIAYANGLHTHADRWWRWFDSMAKVTTTPEGRLIPMIVAIGNHETNKSWSNKPLKKAPYFFTFFQQNGLKSYFARQLGNHSLLLVLDTGHITSHEDQVAWIEKKLTAYPEIKNKLAMYHIPLYPSHRPYKLRDAVAGRKHWMPLFDKHHLKVAFENHDHTFKRTKVLKNNQIVEKDGTIYVGDGCWGRGARSIDRDEWYLEKAESKQHVWSALSSPGRIQLRAEGIGGDVFDEFSIDTSKGLRLIESTHR